METSPKDRDKDAIERAAMDSSSWPTAESSPGFNSRLDNRQTYVSGPSGGGEKSGGRPIPLPFVSLAPENRFVDRVGNGLPPLYLGKASGFPRARREE